MTTQTTPSSGSASLSIIPESRPDQRVRPVERSAKSNLVAYPSRFFGRSNELVGLQRLLTGTRLITILGASGAGKSRLLEQLGLRVVDRYGAQGGVWRCDASFAKTGAELAVAVAIALDLPLDRVDTGDVVDRIANALADRGRMILLLDDVDAAAETVLDAIDAWRRAADGLAIVVTARGPLGLPGEATWHLEPLAVPAEEEARQDLLRRDSARLFLDRAAIARPSYTLDDADVPAVIAILRKLDGLPLALELAASLLKDLTPPQLLAYITHGLDTAPSSSRARNNFAARAIEWVFELASPAEQHVLAQCAFLAESFTLEAAERIVRVDDTKTSLRSILFSLRERALLSDEATSATETRFTMHAGVRAFAKSRLGANGAQAVEHRQAAHHLAHAEALAARVLERGDSRAMRGIEAEAMTLLDVARRPSATPSDIARVALSLDAFLVGRGLVDVLRDLFARALSRGAEGLDAQLRARSLVASAAAALRAGDATSARQGLDAALEQLGGADNDLARARAYRARAEAALASGEDTGSAAIDAARALELAQGQGARREEGVSLATLSAVMLREGRLDDARKLAERAVRVLHDLGDRRSEGDAAALLGAIEARRGDLEAAVRAYDLALAQLRSDAGQRDRAAEGEVIAALAAVHHRAGRSDEAARSCERALALGIDAGDRSLRARVILQLGVIHHDRALYGEARRHYDLAVRLLARGGDRAILSRAYALLGAACADEDDLKNAHVALESADVVRSGDPADATVDLCRGHIDVALARKALEHGDRDGSQALRRSAEERLDHVVADALDARRLLERALRAGATAQRSIGAALLIQRDGRAVRLPSGEVVDLDARDSLSRILAELVRLHEEMPRAALESDDLIRAGWPGTRMSRASGLNRLHVALSTLRKLGLRPYLQRDEDGYRLDPATPTEIVERIEGTALLTALAR